MAESGSGAFLGGLRVILSPVMTERVARPRSPSRARRRARLGHPQHHVVRPQQRAIQLPDGSLVMHPALFEQLRQAVNRQGQPGLHHNLMT